MPIISTLPPQGYHYVVIETMDQNTGRIVFIVALKSTFWKEWGRTTWGTITTIILGGLTLLLRKGVIRYLERDRADQ